MSGEHDGKSEEPPSASCPWLMVIALHGAEAGRASAVLQAVWEQVVSRGTVVGQIGHARNCGQPRVPAESWVVLGFRQMPEVRPWHSLVLQACHDATIKGEGQADQEEDD